MTTLKEVKYEPTVRDRIQRILYRLDHGEKLYDGRLCYGGKFCILGLFADESGKIEWENETDIRYNGWVTLDSMFYESNGEKYVSRLDPELVEYYNLNDALGSFNISDIPEEYREVVTGLLVCNVPNLMFTNDNALRRGYSTEYVNSMLAAIIRSGAIFKKD